MRTKVFARMLIALSIPYAIGIQITGNIGDREDI
jgi:hypothetical protein